MSRYRLLFVLGVISAACTPSTPEPTRLEPLAGAEKGVNQVTDSVVSSGSASQAAVPQAQSSASTPAEVASPFHLVAIGASPIAAEEALYLYDGQLLIGEVAGETVVNHPEYLGSYPQEPLSEVVYLGGKWPEGAFVADTRPHLRSSYTTLMRRVGKRWSRALRTDQAEWVTMVKPWGPRRQLALVVSLDEHRLEVVSGAPRTAPPPTRFFDQEQRRKRPLLRYSDFASLPSGHLFAVGETSVWDSGDWAVEEWAPDSRQAVVWPLPLPAEDVRLSINGIDVQSAQRVYVFGATTRARQGASHDRHPSGSYLAHFDGVTWKAVTLPIEERIVSLGSDGEELWFIAGNHLYHQASLLAPPEKVALPMSAELTALTSTSPDLESWFDVSQVLVRPNHDVWVTAKLLAGTQTVGPLAFRNRPHPQVWRGLEAGTNYQQAIQQHSPLVGADEDCRDFFVLLYSVSQKTPANYDYPATRKALAGHTEFRDVVFAETEELGRRAFGAFTPDLGTSRALVELIRQAVPGSSPIAVCRNPKKVRVLEFDLETGRLLHDQP